MHQAVDWVGDLSAVRHARRAAFRKRFATQTQAHLFDGVFDSFDAALASAPARRPVGYDNPASAALYEDRLEIDEHDYAALFWVSRSLSEGMTRIADIGGSVGIKYFAFGKLVDFPADMLWRVIDVPAVAERGRAFALRQAAGSRLQFSSRLGDADDMDLIFASGSLQYLPQSLAEILEGLSRKPRRIIVNTTPIHAQRSFFTLNSIGTAYCPYRVQSFDAFVGGVTASGYRLRDHWRNVGKQMQLPFEPGYSVGHYSGFCFDLLPQ